MFNYLTNRKQSGKIGSLSVVTKLSIYNWKCMSRKIVFLSIFLSSFFLPGDAMASLANRINWSNVLAGICSLAPLSNSFPCPYASSSKPKCSLYSAERLSTVSFDKVEKSLNKKPSWAESSWYGAVAYQMLKPLMYYFLPMSRKQFKRLVKTEGVYLREQSGFFILETQKIQKLEKQLEKNNFAISELTQVSSKTEAVFDEKTSEILSRVRGAQGDVARLRSTFLTGHSLSKKSIALAARRCKKLKGALDESRKNIANITTQFNSMQNAVNQQVDEVRNSVMVQCKIFTDEIESQKKAIGEIDEKLAVYEQESLDQKKEREGVLAEIQEKERRIQGLVGLLLQQNGSNISNENNLPEGKSFLKKNLDSAGKFFDSSHRVSGVQLRNGVS